MNLQTVPALVVMVFIACMPAGFALAGQSGSTRAELLSHCEGCNLAGQNFAALDLHGISIEGSNLADANFRGANLRGSSFEGANLRNADFRDADLRDARFEGARIAGARFDGARLDGAQFEGIDLRDSAALQSKAQLRKVVERCEGCNMAGIDLSGRTSATPALKARIWRRQI
jgi:uncharacterized protein YjbI with pentapeptide repeats